MPSKNAAILKRLAKSAADHGSKELEAASVMETDTAILTRTMSGLAFQIVAAIHLTAALILEESDGR